MYLRLQLIFLFLAFSVIPSLALPNNHDTPYKRLSNSLADGPSPSLPTQHLNQLYQSTVLEKRQNNGNNFNCTSVCTLNGNVITAGNDVCITVVATGDSNARGASLTMVGTTITAGGDIHINVADRTPGGAIFIWLEDVTLVAGGRIFLNSEEGACLADDCDVIIYMRNVSFVSGSTGTVENVGDAVYYSRLDKGK